MLVNSIYRLGLDRNKKRAMFKLVIVGIVLGFLFELSGQCIIQYAIFEGKPFGPSNQLRTNLRFPAGVVERKRVLIGVMTASKLIDSRASAVWKTWAKDISGDVLFFSSENSTVHSDLPLITLPGVTDAYPPQRKSFMMMKYLHDFGVGKYNFFMRVDDDVYIHGKRLDEFLSTLNSSESLYVGQAGTGLADEKGKLSLEKDENYCMGGSGIIFSEKTLVKLVPHIGDCLQNLYTTHEDVELGRCIREFVGIPCTWNEQMKELLFHSYHYKTKNKKKKKNVFPYQLTGMEMDKAITLHPVKLPKTMYMIRQEMAIRRNAKLEMKKLSLTRELKGLYQSTEHSQGVTTDTPSSNCYDIIPWKLITRRHNEFMHGMRDVMRGNYQGPWKHLMKEVINYIWLCYNSFNRVSRIGKIVRNLSLIYGYHRFHPIWGVQLLLKLQVRQLNIYRKPWRSLIGKEILLDLPLGLPNVHELKVENHIIHFIMSLSGKLTRFKQLLKNFESVCGSSQMCDLLIVLYESIESEETVKVIQESPYQHLIRVVQGHGSFSRASALHQGMMLMNKSDLVCFIDVDMYFNHWTLTRILQHTRLNEQVYFPIVFSQYNSHMVCGSHQCPFDNYSTNAGYFRPFAYGIVSLYKADYDKYGGFNLNVKGWGKEDVDLFTTVLKRGLTVYRAPDPSLVHIYHPKTCDPTLPTNQHWMCVDSRSRSFATQQMLAKLYFNSSALFSDV